MTGSVTRTSTAVDSADCGRWREQKTLVRTDVNAEVPCRRSLVCSSATLGSGLLAHKGSVVVLRRGLRWLVLVGAENPVTASDQRFRYLPTPQPQPETGRHDR
jgi:hypothetical protein